MSENVVKSARASGGCTCLRLRKASRRVSQIYDLHLERHGLTITQYGLLAQLKANDGISVGALAEKLVMDPTTLTRNLKPLERRGLVSMIPDERDRRARRLHLTADGATSFAEARPAWVEAQGKVESILGGEETAALHRALDRALALLA